MKTSILLLLMTLILGSSCRQKTKAPCEVGFASPVPVPVVESAPADGITNIQEAGVAEADFVKVSDKYIYVAQNNILNIIDRDSSEILFSKKFEQTPNLLIESDEDQDTIIASYLTSNSIHIDFLKNTGTALELTENKQIPGRIIQARKTNDHLIFISSKINSNYKHPTEAEVGNNDPQRSECQAAKNTLELESDMFIAPPPTDYLLTVIPISNPQITKTKTLPSSYQASVFYLSETHMYFLKGYGNYTEIESTNLFENITETKSLKVQGYIKDRWSVKEISNGVLAIVTTDNIWNDSEQSYDANQVHTVDFSTEPKILGSLTGLAAGETVRSVRYIGDMVYVVTFRTMDPLFAIDLSQPGSPTLIGELKIPGFSSYLHPVNDKFLIGLGYDSDTNGFSRGVQLSLFDIDDPANLVRTDVKVYGTHGDTSLAQTEPKAFMHDSEKQLIAFPLRINAEDFDGLSIFSYADALNEIGRISHRELKPKYCANSQINYYYGSNDIQRSFIIDGKLWAFSQYGVTVHDPDSLGKLNSVLFADPKCPWYAYDQY